MLYLRVLERFLTSVLLSKDEYNISSKHFNPLRLLVTTFLVMNVGLTIFLMSNMVTVYDVLDTTCPGVIDKIKNEK